MKLINLKRVNDHKVEKWLFDNIKELSPYQKEWIRNEEIVRFAPFKFYEKREKVSNIFLRFSVLFMPIVWTSIVITLPINFLITGKWGYNSLNWYSKWVSSCGL